MNEDISAPAVEVRGLEKSFGEYRALRGIDMTVSRGECLVVFGPNGAGKTTLLKILSTLMKPSGGIVRLDGINVKDKGTQIRRRISLVSHQTFLYDTLTVHENLRFYGKMYDVQDLEKRISEVASRVGLEPRLHDRAGTLSRGLQQRASIARAILHNPSILFLDEPEVGLDPHACGAIRDILGGIHDEGRTIVMTTHDLKRGLEIGNSFIVIDRGKVVYRASVDELEKADVREVYDSCVQARK